MVRTTDPSKGGGGSPETGGPLSEDGKGAGKKGGKKARQFKVAELQRSKMHIVVVGYIRELHV